MYLPCVVYVAQPLLTASTCTYSYSTKEVVNYVADRNST